MHILSKSTYIKGEQCQKALYMLKKHPYLRDKLSPEQRAIFKRGTDVGLLAQKLYPNGINMSPSSPSQFEKMFHQTMENINNPNINTLYEAVFIYKDTLIMLDILVRDGEKWKAIEVKSSMAVSETYRNDAALQYYVLHGCNVPISDIQLMYINSNYVKNGELDLEQLFVYESVKEFAEQKINYIDEKVSILKEVLKLNNAPKTNIGTQCFTPYYCDFRGHCWKNVPDNSYLYTSAMNDKDMFSLYNSGIKDNKSFKRYIDDSSLGMNQLEALEQDTYYINYKIFYDIIGSKTESTAFLNVLFYRPAIPILDGNKPYQDTILAFSIFSDQNEETFYWDCLNDYSKMYEGLQILIDKIKKYEKIIYFSPENINNMMQHYKTNEWKDVMYKIVNFRDILISADYFDKNSKYNFSLKNIYERLFPDEKIFEHGRIILNAMSDNVLDKDLIAPDMKSECKYLQRIYKHFTK